MLRRQRSGAVRRISTPMCLRTYGWLAAPKNDSVANSPLLTLYKALSSNGDFDRVISGCFENIHVVRTPDPMLDKVCTTFAASALSSGGSFTALTCSLGMLHVGLARFCRCAAEHHSLEASVPADGVYTNMYWCCAFEECIGAVSSALVSVEPYKGARV